MELHPRELLAAHQEGLLALHDGMQEAGPGPSLREGAQPGARRWPVRRETPLHRTFGVEVRVGKKSRGQVERANF